MFITNVQWIYWFSILITVRDMKIFICPIVFFFFFFIICPNIPWPPIIHFVGLCSNHVLILSCSGVYSTICLRSYAYAICRLDGDERGEKIVRLSLHNRSVINDGIFFFLSYALVHISQVEVPVRGQPPHTSPLLVACTRIYILPCWSVGRLVGRSLRPSHLKLCLFKVF